MARRILVVEDSPTQAEQLRLLLEGEGYEVEVAADGREGLERVRRAAPDLIISDVVMPGMDGYAFCQAVKSAPATSALPFVLLTERRTALDILRGLEQGADNFITKPFEDEVLLERIRRIFEQLEGREQGQLRVDVRLRLAGRQVLISADKQQIVELLFSTFEELCRTNDSLAASRRTVEEYARSLEAKVAERTRELRSLFDGVPVGLFRATPAGRILEANPVLVQMLGYPDLESLLAVNIVDLYADPGERRRWQALIEREGIVRDFEAQLRRRNGSLFWQRITLRAVRDVEGGVVHYEGVAEDITERKSAEAEAERRRREGEVLAGLAGDLNASLDLESVLHGVAEGAKALCGADLIGIALPEPGSDAVVLRHRLGASEAGHDGVLIEPGKGIGGQVLVTGRPFRTDHYAHDPRITKDHLHLILAEGVVAAMVVPIRSEDRIEGLLYAENRSTRPFSDRDEAILARLADHAAIAIRNARLYQEAERRLRQTETLLAVSHAVGSSLEVAEVVRRTVRELVRALGADVGGALRLSPTRDALLPLSGYRIPKDALDWYSRTPLPFSGWLVDEIEARGGAGYWPDSRSDPRFEHPLFRPLAHRSVLIVPLWLKDEIMGLFTMVWLRESPPLTFEDRRLAEGIARHAAVAIENARLFERVEAVQQQYQLVTESLADMVFMLDPEGKFVFSNTAAERLTGYRLGELRGRPFSELVVPEDLQALSDRFRRALGSEPLGPQVEVRIVRKDGSQVPVELSMDNLVVDGRIGGRVGVARDLTERKSLEAQLRQAQKMDAIGRLAGGVAHDFNNMLTVITGRSQLLLRRLEPGNPLRRHVELIEKTAGRAGALTQQLLAFSRKQVLQPKVLDLNTVVTGMEKMLRRLIGEDVELVTAAEPSLGRVKADPGQLEQVVLNLVVNARDAMPRGGRLTIEMGNVELDAAFVQRHAGARPGRYVRLGVVDTGIGMDAEVQSHLFEPFFTTKSPDKGTGLGLATVYGIVKQSGGYIAVESAPGRGARFDVYLPRLDDAEAAVERRPPAAEPGQGSETVLLVEDEESVRELALEILQMHGYTVLAARHGAEALEVSDQHPGPIHLLVADVVMPHMSGRELSERLRTRRAELRVLYVSGYTDDAILRHGVREAGIVLLQKPFTPDALARTVREVLDRDG